MSDEEEAAPKGSLRQYDDIPGRAHLYIGGARKNVAVLVEGSSDRNALSMVCPRASIFVAGTRDKVFVNAIELQELGDQRFLCVYDADFKDPAELNDLQGHTLPYSEADLEAMLLELGGHEKLLDHALTPERLSQAGGARVLSVAAKTAAMQVAPVRRANADVNWGLPFVRVSAGRFISDDLSFDSCGYILELCDRREPTDDFPNLAATEVHLQLMSLPTEHTYRGRDFLEIVAAFLQLPYLKPKKGIAAGPKNLEFALHFGSDANVAVSDWGNKLTSMIESVRSAAQSRQRQGFTLA